MHVHTHIASQPAPTYLPVVSSSWFRELIVRFNIRTEAKNDCPVSFQATLSSIFLPSSVVKPSLCKRSRLISACEPTSLSTLWSRARPSNGCQVMGNQKGAYPETLCMLTKVLGSAGSGSDTVGICARARRTTLLVKQSSRSSSQMKSLEK